jgi:hypothetical protein
VGERRRRLRGSLGALRRGGVRQLHVDPHASAPGDHLPRRRRSAATARAVQRPRVRRSAPSCTAAWKPSPSAGRG